MLNFLIKSVNLKLRNTFNRIVRPSAVTEAQHNHLKANPRCAACDSDEGAQAHHIQPYNKFPELGADPTNFITLCEYPAGLECHLKIGHGQSFKCYVEQVVEIAKDFKMAQTQSERNLLWELAKASRLPNQA